MLEDFNPGYVYQDGLQVHPGKQKKVRGFKGKKKKNETGYISCFETVMLSFKNQ